MSQSFLPLLYSAFEHPFGIVIQTNDPDRLKQKLYAERRSSGDPVLEQLILCTSRTNPEGEVWVVRKSPSRSLASAARAEAD